MRQNIFPAFSFLPLRLIAHDRQSVADNFVGHKCLSLILKRSIFLWVCLIDCAGKNQWNETLWPTKLSCAVSPIRFTAWDRATWDTVLCTDRCINERIRIRDKSDVHYCHINRYIWMLNEINRLAETCRMAKFACDFNIWIKVGN